MRRSLAAIVFAGAIFTVISVSTAPARAGDWMFRRSYYSHAPAPGTVEEPISTRSAYREPWVGAHPRFAIRGGWRFNTFTLQNGFGSTDRTFFRENYYDVNY
jgi:hypothetical protein